MERVFKNNWNGSIDYHQSVLLQEAIDALNVRPGEKYIDCTLGGGGHTIEIIKRGGLVLGIDTDSDALEHFKKSSVFTDFNTQKKIILVKGNFQDLERIATNYGFKEISGILYDLGVSTHQLKTNGRGFSFGNEDNLDMRLDNSEGVTAVEVINKKTKKELYEIFTKFGEERRAWTIADSIVRAREIKPLTTTSELSDLILKVTGKRGKKDRTHPATRVFQALRIYLNNELAVLEKSLPQALGLLKSEGRLAVISFHSLEDRIVKRFLQMEETDGKIKVLTKKPIRPKGSEVNDNPSARSGKLRIGQKI